MIVHSRRTDGSPLEVEFDAMEALVAQVHSRLMDSGMDQGTACTILLGGTLVSTAGDPDHRELDAVLADNEFLAYLAG